MSALQRSRETGVKQQRLPRWLRDARSLPLMASEQVVARKWTVAQKARVVSEGSKLSGDQPTAYLAREEVRLADYERWRIAICSIQAFHVAVLHRPPRLDEATLDAMTASPLLELVADEFGAVVDAQGRGPTASPVPRAAHRGPDDRPNQNGDARSGTRAPKMISSPEVILVICPGSVPAAVDVIGHSTYRRNGSQSSLFSHGEARELK